ncbi:MAG: hypothetical protein R6V62_07130 [Candidatus Fermentibacteraceae bacterium]
MKRTALLIALALTAIAGCGVKQAPVTFTNDLGAWDIIEVYIDPTDQPWTENLITTPVAPGESVTLNVAPGSYDIRCVDEDGDPYTKWDVVIGSEGYTWNVTLAHMD